MKDKRHSRSGNTTRKKKISPTRFPAIIRHPNRKRTVPQVQILDAHFAPIIPAGSHDRARTDDTNGPIRLFQAIELYLELHGSKLKSSLMLERCVRKYIPLFGDRPLGDIAIAEVSRWHAWIGKNYGLYAANHALTSLRAVYAKMIEWDYYAGKSPGRYVKKITMPSRTQIIRNEDLPGVIDSIRQEPAPYSIYFLTILLTACRRTEALTMQWDDIDLTRGVWTKPMTKNGTPHTVTLPPQLVQQIQRLPRKGAYVFHSSRGKHHLSTQSVEEAWQRIRNRVGLPQVRIHDLRRTKATRMAEQGVTLSIIRDVLNHHSLKTTDVYIRGLHNSPALRQALDADADLMFGNSDTQNKKESA